MKLFDPGVAAGACLMQAAANATVVLLPGLRAVIPAFLVWMRPFLKGWDLKP
jgi:hypothetical protein